MNKVINRKGCILILARAGSKGIANKNMIDVCGKPLIYYAIKAAKDFGNLDIFVSSDSKEILDYAKSLKVLTVERPINISNDLSLDLEGFEHFFNIYKEYDYSVHLRATFPLINKNIIESANELFLKNYDKFDSLRSVIPVSQSPYKMWHIDEGIAKTVIPGNTQHSSPRQIIKNSFIQNACIDITKRKNVLESKNMIGRKCLPYIMKKTDNIDIDNINDLKEAINAIRIRDGKQPSR
tara:strand:+ start:3153 stop:3866 length:714 start_codon:yes stop_codon:yes gene_type:complete